MHKWGSLRKLREKMQNQDKQLLILKHNDLWRLLHSILRCLSDRHNVQPALIPFSHINDLAVQYYNHFWHTNSWNIDYIKWVKKS